MALLGFALPPDSGEKLSLGMLTIIYYCSCDGISHFVNISPSFSHIILRLFLLCVYRLTNRRYDIAVTYCIFEYGG